MKNKKNPGISYVSRSEALDVKSQSSQSTRYLIQNGTICLKSQFKLNYGIIYALHSMHIQLYCVFILETIFRSIVQFCLLVRRMAFSVKLSSTTSMQRGDKIIVKLLFISRFGVRSFQNHNGNNINMKYCNELARISNRRHIWPFYLKSQLSKTTKLFIFSALHPCVSKFTENSCAREKI